MCTSRAMAQINAAISRAIATTPGLACVPRAVRCRKRVHKRTGAFHPIWMAADLGRIPVGPSALEECPAGDRVAGVGDAALAVAFATEGRTGGEAERAHELSWILETGPITEFSHAGDGHRELDAAHGLERLDDGGQTPRRDLLTAFGLETREPCLMCRRGADVLLEDHVLGGRRTDDCRQPAQRGRPPRVTALIPDILAQQAGLQAALGGLAIPDGIRARGRGWPRPRPRGHRLASDCRNASAGRAGWRRVERF